MKGSKGVLLLLFPLLFAGAAPAVQVKAGSGAYWKGSDASGLILTEEDCPLIVEHEELTVRIPEFPKCGGNEEDFKGYSAAAEARYTFYNPESYTVSAKLLFPFGANPSYAPQIQTVSEPVVTADGKKVDFGFRHTYRNGEDDLDGETKLVSEERRKDAFYEADLPVTEYEVTVYIPETEKSVYFNMSFECNPLRTRLLLRDCPFAGIKNGYAALSYRFPAGEHTFSFYAVGEEGGVAAKSVSYEKNCDTVVEGGRAEVRSISRKSFTEFVASQYPQGCGMSETDWYNGYVDMLNCGNHARKGLEFIVCNCAVGAESFKRWCEYTLVIPAGERVVSSVTAPLFPAIDLSGGARYLYTYLLSPAQKWADFKEIEIAIETPYHLESSSLEFQKDGNVYRFRRDALPQGELSFTLTEAENSATGAAPFKTTRIMPRMQRTILVLTAVVVIAVAVTVGSLASVKMKRRIDKNNEKKNKN